MDRRNFATRLSIFAAAFVPAVVRGQKPPPITVPGGQKQGTGIKEVVGEAAVKGHPGVYGYNFHGGDGVDGQSDSGNGVHGQASTGNGIFGESPSGVGVKGESGGDSGVSGTSKTGWGVVGRTEQREGSNGGVWGSGISGPGVWGQSLAGNGVYGTGNIGVFGKGEDGVYGEGTASAIHGVCENANGYAGFFKGNVKLTNHLIVGGTRLPGQMQPGITVYSHGHVEVDGDVILTNLNAAGHVSKASGSFKIDHPLAPDKKYLSHSFVESPDMMNVYNGNVTTDASGDATVALPTYFAALNRDCRYQLTVIGQFAQAIVASEIKDNRFTIKTDKPSVKVSWQVTGIRQDAWANAHRIQVEEDKHAKEVGSYLHPEVFGQPAEKRLALNTAGRDS